ncbi:MAG TPA: hypothetical protein VGC26_11630 [Afipia sp.]
MKFSLTPVIRAVAAQFGYSYERIPTDKRPAPDMTTFTKFVANTIRSQNDGVVSTGPFRGMKMSSSTPWSSHDQASRLLGCYEQELHPAIEQAISRNPDLVINIGSGDGYYATGLALRVPMANVIAFDTLVPAQIATKAIAKLNKVDGRVEARGHCDPEALAKLVSRSQRALIFSDCEGYEEKLFSADTINAYRDSSLIIECHDFQDSRVTKKLTDLFSATHHVLNIVEGARNPNEFSCLENQSSLFRWVAVCEFRPALMHWLSVTPK